MGLASAKGIFSGLSTIIDGQEMVLGFLSLALGLLGGMAVYRYFKMYLIEEWIYYLWLIPQTISITIDTFDRVNMTVSGDMIYGTYLLLHLSFVLAWELQSNSYLMVNFSVPAILGILILPSILSRLKSH